MILDYYQTSSLILL